MTLWASRPRRPNSAPPTRANATSAAMNQKKSS
ncbi:Uncharacterised protein [Bordetella pertussis]|nr:Uncharacterised protein [Bordetella pertussis]